MGASRGRNMSEVRGWRVGASAAVIAAGLTAGAAGQCGSTRVGLVFPTATFSQNCYNFHSTYLVDGNPNTAWAIGRCGMPGDSTWSETAAFETWGDVAPAADQELEFTIFSGGFWNCCGAGNTTLGHFRISVTGDDRSTFANGIGAGGDVSANWTPIDATLMDVMETDRWAVPVLAQREAPRMIARPAHAILVEGEDVEFAVYTVRARSPLPRITGVRLEIIDSNGSESASMDLGLPTGGPGRHSNGNVIIREFSMGLRSGVASISSHPSDQLTCPGGSARFSVAVSGAPDATYQWRRNGFEIPGARGAMLELAGVQVTDEGRYDCVVTTPCGFLVSRGAELSVCPANFNCDGRVSIEDYDAFVAAFEVGDERADVNGDGFLDFFDFDDFMAAYESGC